MFVKYPHVVRLDSDEVDDLLIGECYVFPKIDGTNASVWWYGGLKAGSRTRVLTLDQDNAGFLKAVLGSDLTLKLTAFFEFSPDARLYGEWLVPHSLKTYEEGAWRKFYIFDVGFPADPEDDRYEFTNYDLYAPKLEEFGLDYIPLLCKVTNPTVEWLTKQLHHNTFLIRDGAGIGEGIVIKRYDFVNEWGRCQWGKIVRNEFKEQNRKVFGAPTTELAPIEAKIANQFVTIGRVQKIIAKMKVDKPDEPWGSRRIPELLGRVWRDVIDDTWEILSKFKRATIDFRKLNQLVTLKVKELVPELFGG